MTIDLPSTAGVVPFGRNAALPDRDTTTASSSCAAGGVLSSQTVTRSLSISGFGAVCGPAWNRIAKSSKGIIGAPFRKQCARYKIHRKGGIVELIVDRD